MFEGREMFTYAVVLLCQVRAVLEGAAREPPGRGLAGALPG